MGEGVSLLGVFAQVEPAAAKEVREARRAKRAVERIYIVFGQAGCGELCLWRSVGGVFEIWNLEWWVWYGKGRTR